MNDINRLKALERYKILGDAREPALDDIVQLAAELFQSQVALVNLIGETECWYKASVGTSMTGVVRKDTFCDIAVTTKKMLVIEDARLDPRYSENPYVTSKDTFRFYAGAPLISPDGYAIGTLCVLSREPRLFTADQGKSLERLANLVVRLLEDRLKVQAQEEQKQFLDVVLENLTDGVIACNGEAQLTLFNKATREFHGIDSNRDLKPEEWNQYYRLFEADGVTVMQPERIPLLRAYRQETVKDQEMVVSTREGTKRSLVCSGRALFGIDGKKIGAVLAMQDITERKKAQACLEATNAALVETNRALREASAAKSEFLTNMSHELRTPLNGVLGVADLILEGQLPSETKQQIELIQSSAEKLLAIIGNILDFSNAEAGRLEIDATEFDFESMVYGAQQGLELLAREKNLSLTLNLESSPIPKFIGDPNRIQQVLHHLISNAIKFTESGRIVTNVTFHKGEHDLTLAHIRVTDTGIGISEEAISKLFQAFTQADGSLTRRYGGTGLGLSIAKQLVQLMGGRIGVESIQGEGSTFWVTLPLKNPNTTHGIAEASAPKEFRVLVVEDTPDIRMVSMRMLAKLGLMADAVENGKEALEAVRNHDYDLVLMDCQMPEMDGYDATRFIRLLDDPVRARVPIIAVTAHAMIGDREKCIASGMDDYLPKPVRLKEMQETIARYLPIERRTTVA